MTNSSVGNKDNTNNNQQATHVQLSVQGMSCQSCASRIEKLLMTKHAIHSASVSKAGEMANISFDAEQVDVEQIIAWINKAGFIATVFAPHFMSSSDSLSASSVTSSSMSPQILQTESENGYLQNKVIADKLAKLTKNWRLLVLVVCFMPFAIGMLGMLFGFGMQWMIPAWLQFVLATFVQLVIAIPFYRGAWSSIKGGMANMDVLVALGTLTIWAYSSFVWLQGLLSPESLMGSAHHVYFEAGVMIIAFISFGKYIEQRTTRQSLNSIEMMLSLMPTLVEKQSDIGEFYETDLAEVQVADVLRAKQGTRIATDGMVIEGEGWCDESHLTGESQLLLKEVGDKVLAGAMVENGSLTYRVYAKGADSQLGDMISALSEAQNSKAPIARLADKVAGIFVPLVLIIAVMTLVGTYSYTSSVETAILHAVAVLVVACPCALGLATPSAIMVGMGLASRHGVIFKNAEAMEKSGQVDTVVFDKTGTLTKGKPTLVAHLLMDKSLRYNEVLQLASSVEAHTSHPFATALVESAKKDRLSLLPTTDIEVIVGKGVQGNVDGLGMVKVGSPSWLNVSLPEEIATKIPKALQVSSLVAVSIDDIPLGFFAFADEVRADAKETIEKLHDADIDVILMSGDRAEVVEYVSDVLAINDAYADMSPREKAEEIQALQEQGHTIAMLGDGVNDSPAMVTADASFAMSNGTDITKNSADACLMGHSTTQMVDAIAIANQTVKHIKQNLFFAFIYNFLAIPLAVFGFLNPMLAAALMSLSSISVLINAVRLNSYQP